MGPAPVRGLAGCDIIMVRTGAHHTVALDRSGAVWAFGRGSYGQVGGEYQLGGKSVDKEVAVKVAVKEIAFEVKDAGSNKVNGTYYLSEEVVDGCASYENENGVVLIRYKMARSGERYRYFTSKGGNLSDPQGDYYRVKP